MGAAQTEARGARVRGEGAGPGRGRRGLLSGGGGGGGGGGGFGAAVLAAGSRLGWAPRTRTRGQAPGTRPQPTTLRPSGGVAAAGLGRAARRDRGRRGGRARAPRAGTRQVGGPGRAGPGATRRPRAAGDRDAPRGERGAAGRGAHPDTRRAGRGRRRRLSWKSYSLAVSWRWRLWRMIRPRRPLAG